MPTYEYECAKCKNRFEARQSFAEAPLTTCPECGGSVRRVFQPVGIIFKGSGWYVTDSRKPETSSTTSTAEKSGTETSSADKPAAESKPAGSANGAGTSTSDSGSASSTAKSGSSDKTGG